MKFNSYANNFRDELGHGSSIHSSGFSNAGDTGQHTQRLSGQRGFDTRRQIDRNRRLVRNYRDAGVRTQYRHEAKFNKDDQLHPDTDDEQNSEENVDERDAQNGIERGEDGEVLQLYRRDPRATDTPAQPTKPQFDVRNGGMTDQVALSCGGTLAQGGGYDSMGRYISKSAVGSYANRGGSSKSVGSRNGAQVRGVGRARLGQQARDAAYLQRNGHYGSKNDRFRGGTYHSKFERQPIQQHAFREPQHRGYDPYAH